MQLGFVFSLVFAIIIAAFALNNGEKVTIDFLFTTHEVSQALVILVSTAFGAVIVTIFGLVRQIKLSLKVKEQGKAIKALQEEKDELLLKLESKSNEEQKDVIEAPKADENKQQQPSLDEKDEKEQEAEKPADIEIVESSGVIDKDLENELEKELELEKDNQ